MHSDDELLDAIAQGLADASGSWTLTEAAHAAGVHPATLVKRFGSKHAVLVALSKRWGEALPKEPLTDDCFAELGAWADRVVRPPREPSRGVAALPMLLAHLQAYDLS